MNKAFTLIEVIIYTAIISIFMSAAITFTWNLLLTGEKSSVQQVVNQDLRFVSDRISYEIRNAQAINSITPTSISLSMTDSNRNPTVIDLNSSTLRIGYGNSGSCPTSSPCPLTSAPVNITSLLLENLSLSNSKNVRYSISAEYNSSSNKKEYQYSQTLTSSAEVR